MQNLFVDAEALKTKTFRVCCYIFLSPPPPSFNQRKHFYSNVKASVLSYIGASQWKSQFNRSNAQNIVKLLFDISWFDNLNRKDLHKTLERITINLCNKPHIKSLSRRFSIIFLQETWLYRYQASTLTDIYDNTEFVSGCVDAPVPPSLHSRGYGGTCILWHCSMNSLMKQLPETSVRINVVELKCPMTPFCLVNVYLPARGVAENEPLFEECLDELHEIFIKYSPSHTVVFGGDFNASLHRGHQLRRDVLFREFVKEHSLQPDASYPKRDTFFHECVK